MIIGISGLAGSGKDTAADFLVKDHNFVRLALADKLKRICKDVFDFSIEQLWGPSSARNKPDERYKRGPCPQCNDDPEKRAMCEGSSLYLTPRHALQQLGTEWGRACYDNVWIEDGLRTAKLILEKSDRGTPRFHYDATEGLSLCRGYPCNLRSDGVVIPDIRFKNEMKAIKEAGGHLIRMKRGIGLAGEGSLHRSEAEQLEVPDEYFSAVIYNENLTLDELRQEVTRVFKTLC